MDWPRAIVLAMVVVTCACYVAEFVEVVRDAWGVWHPAMRGRVALCVGIVLACAAAIHGLVAQWGMHLTVRVPLWAGAALCFVYGYLHMTHFQVRR